MKSEFRKAYEQRFGVVNGSLELYDAKGNQIYIEHSDGFWVKYECDSQGNLTYRECSDDGWEKYEYDAKGKLVYREDSERGITIDNRETCEGKIVTIDGKEYQLTEINRRK